MPLFKFKMTRENWRSEILVRMRGSKGKQMSHPPTTGGIEGTTRVLSGVDDENWEDKDVCRTPARKIWWDESLRAPSWGFAPKRALDPADKHIRTRKNSKSVSVLPFPPWYVAYFCLDNGCHMFLYSLSFSRQLHTCWVSLLAWFLWHINFCRLFNAKSIFIK